MFTLIEVMLRRRQDQRPIWLFGENLGKTANNNAYYFWRHVVCRHLDSVAAYLLLEPTKENRRRVAAMPTRESDYVIWRHSPAHAWLYVHAEMAFVALSFRDVWPECVKLFGFVKSFKPKKRCSLVYLQHGTLGIKALGYGPTYADNTMLRFVYYNPLIRQRLVEVNGFKPYQLFYGVYHPRYQELVRRWKTAVADRHSSRKIFWFLTWREYMAKNITTYKFFFNMAKVLKATALREYLERTDSTITICMHQLTTSKCAQYLPLLEDVSTSRMKMVYATDIDVMDEIATSDLLVTDYSSLGFDFTFLRKPVLLYAPDLEAYNRTRPFYCKRKEFEAAAILKPDDLISVLTREAYPPLNHFFASRCELPDEGIYEKVRNGDYIERFYQYFKTLQDETYVFLGYDFSGVGGTVYATKALAEGLLEAGKRVVFSPLKNGGTGQYPAGVVNHPLVDYNNHSKIARFQRKYIGSRRDYSYLSDDKDMPNLRPYCGWALTRLMRTIRAKAVISTRETMHFFLHDATSPWLKEKFYYFHCHAGLIDKLFPGTINRLKCRNLETALFVTRRNQELLDETFGYRHYQRFAITGNALDSSRMIGENELVAVKEKAVYKVVYLLRLSEERWPDVERALQFARYLKSCGQDRIKIDIFGKGDQVLKLQYLLVEEGIDDVMAYRGETRNLVATYRSHDAMVDFSSFQSFGMGYIEAVFNGRMPFCLHNEGSDEVLCDLPKCFFSTDEQLEEKILALPSVTVEELRQNYEILGRRYSRRAVVEAVINADA